MAQVVSKIQNSYKLAIGIMTALMVFIAVFGTIEIQSLRYDAHIINLAGRQRMLSQRIGKLAAKIIYTQDITEVEKMALRMDSINIIWNNVHIGLQSGDNYYNLPKPELSDKLQKLFAEIDPIQHRINRNVQAVLLAIKRGRKDEADKFAASILEEDTVFLEKMEYIVKQFDDESSERVMTLIFSLISICLVGICIIFLQGFFIFRPMRKYLGSYLDLIKSREDEVREKNTKLNAAVEEIQEAHEQLQAANEELTQTLDYTQQLKGEIQTSEDMLIEAQRIAKMGSYYYDVLSNKNYWSPQAAVNFGMPVGTKLEDEKILELIVEEDRIKYINAWATAYETREPFSIEFRIKTPDGALRYMVGNGNPIFNREGQLLKVIGTIQDITTYKELNIELDLAKQAAESALVARSHFLSTMSHEIRTPLNAVVGFTNILLMEEPRDDQQENLNTLNYSANHLLSLVNDVLDYAKIESGKLELDLSTVAIDEELFKIQKMFALRADEKEIHFKLNGIGALKYAVQADELRLVQILTNLISNAIKFTEKGGITVGYQLLDETDEAYTLKFFVKDTGIGITEDKLWTIFDPFKQAESSTTRKYGGTGLGLSITKNLVELMGGTIGINSELGKGSEFWFTVNLKKGLSLSKMEAMAHKSADSGDFSLKDVTILVVDDNEINRMVAGKFLKKWGANVFNAASGNEAIESVQANNFNLILMDLHMPELDGFETTNTIKNLEGGKFAHIPVLALTASVSFEVQEEVRKQGFNGYVTKPFLPSQLIETIQRNLNRVSN